MTFSSSKQQEVNRLPQLLLFQTPMANPKSKLEPKSRPIIEPLADFNFATNPSSPLPPQSVTIKSLAITALPSDPHQSLVYVGSLAGGLFLLSLNPTAAAENRLSLLKRAVIGNGSPLVSVLTAGTLNKVVVCAGDGVLYLLDSLLLEPAKKVSVKGGVTVVARRFLSKNSNYSNLDKNLPQSNGSSGKASFFVAATSKKLVFMELNAAGSLVIAKEIVGIFEGLITDMVWVDDSVIFGTKKGYFLYSCVNGQCGLIFSLPELSGRPQLKLLAKECRVLLLVDNVGVSVDAEGQPVGGSLVFWSVPDSIGEIGSHVLVVKNGKLEVYHKKSGNCMQLVMLSGDAGGGWCVLADQDGCEELLAVSTSSKVYGRF